MTRELTVITSFLFRRKVSNRDMQTKAPLYIRVRYGTLQAQTATGISVNPNCFDTIKKELKARSVMHLNEKREINERIRGILDRIEERKGQLNTTTTNDELRQWLTEIVNGQSAPNNTPFFESLERYILKSDSTATQRNGAVMMRTLRRFEQYNGLTLTFDSLDVAMLQGWNKYLITEHKLYIKHPELWADFPEKRHPQPRGNNTLAVLHKRFSFFLSDCVKRGIISANPYGKYHDRPREQYDNYIVALTKEEREAIANAKLDSPLLEEQRDIFLFHCHVGCRVADLTLLTKSDVINGTITIKQGKTGVVTSIPLTETAMAIIAKYADRDGEKLLPFIDHVLYNRALKKIGKAANLTQKRKVTNPLTGKQESIPLCDLLTTHVARRTFISMLVNSGESAAVVGSMSGHAKGSKALGRYYEINEETKAKAIKGLE